MTSFTIFQPLHGFAEYHGGELSIPGLRNRKLVMRYEIQHTPNVETRMPASTYHTTRHSTPAQRHITLYHHGSGIHQDEWRWE
jgi:hypothetical protein